MTLEEAIKYMEEVAKENDDSAKEFYRISKLETHPDRKLAEDGYVECKKCVDEHRQLAEWLRKLQEIKEIYDNWNVDFGIGDQRTLFSIGEVLNGNDTGRSDYSR